MPALAAATQRDYEAWAPLDARHAKIAREGDQLVQAAVAATQAQEAVRQDAAREEGVELVLDELRQVGAGLGLSLREEGRSMLRYLSAQRGVFQAAAL